MLTDEDKPIALPLVAHVRTRGKNYQKAKLGHSVHFVCGLHCTKQVCSSAHVLLGSPICNSKSGWDEATSSL